VPKVPGPPCRYHQLQTQVSNRKSCKGLRCKDFFFLLALSGLQVHQLKGERSYHILYQLVKGVQDKKLRESLCLPNRPSDFHYLSRSGCVVRLDNLTTAVWGQLEQQSDCQSPW